MNLSSASDPLSEDRPSDPPDFASESRDRGQDAFSHALNLHRKILYKVAYTYCADREDRRDLAQDIVAELWESFPRYDGRVLFSTWMYRIAVNVSISRLRREGRRLRDGRDTVSMELVDFDIAAADAAFGPDSDNMRTLRTLIDQLDEVNRALLLLYLDGHSAEEIASVLGFTPSNVTTRINRLRQKLQVQFAA